MIESATPKAVPGGFCPQCDTPADDGLTFCKKCGAALRPPVPLTQPSSRGANGPALDGSDWSRKDIAQWVGTILWIVLLESHVISRPLVFLFGPFIMLLSFVTIAFPVPRKRLRQICLGAVAMSIGGFLLTKYVFR